MTQTVKNPPAMQETQGESLGWEDPLEKGMATHLVFLPGELHGQRSLAGYSPRGRKESDRTERLNNNNDGHPSGFKGDEPLHWLT